MKYLTAFGSFTMAYATMQPGMRYFELPDAGYIAYSTADYLPVGKRVIAFFDPVCDPRACDALLNAFLDRFPRAGFMQIYRDTAQRLAARGFFINQLGIETRLAVHAFSPGGTPRARLREALNRAQRHRLSCRELSNGMSAAERAAIHDAMRDLSALWMRTRKVSCREVRYIIRPARFDDDPLVRQFIITDREGRLQGYAFYDPVFRQGNVIGYTPAVARFSPFACKGVNYFLNLSALEVFRREGIQFIELGLSPLYGLRPPGFKTSWVTHALFKGIFRWGERLYGFRGLSEHKRQYRGIERPVYAAMPVQLPFGYVYAAFRHIGVL